MITTISFALSAAFCSAVAVPSHESRVTNHAVADSTYRALYESGDTFAAFVAKATARKEQWEGNYAMKVAPDALVTRARALAFRMEAPGHAGRCSDSVNSVPYLASFLDKVPTIEMRLIRSAVGMSILEAHRTPDGRPATPTVILLDAGIQRTRLLDRTPGCAYRAPERPEGHAER
jgi:hypothetical protein